MGRAPCCEKIGLKKGPWSRDEDQTLINYINENGHGNWRALPKKAGLLRCGKSCRLRWTNYLRPDIKRGNFTKEEEDTIIDLHKELGNKWSAIAAKLAGRTDNEIKNIWHTHLKKKLNPPPEPVKRVRKRSKPNNPKAKKDAEMAKQQEHKSGEAMTPAHSHTHTPGEAKTEDRNSPSLSSSSDKSSSITDVNIGNASTGSDSMSETFQKFLQVDDDFWADVISGEDNSSCHFTGELQGVNNGGEPQFESIQSTGCVYDFDPIMPEDMEFWYNIFTKDGEIQDLLLDL